VLLHRLNVAVIGLRVRHWETYVPALAEVGITLAITAGAAFVFGVLARILPIHEELAHSRATQHSAAAPARAVPRAQGAS
jgi:Ni/Fe-hydrogenase subunit HybB-like protein